MQNKLEAIEQNLIAAAHGCLTNEEIRLNAEWLFAEVERLHRILHDLTPGGSEFYHDADRCAENIREQIDISRRIAKQTMRNSRSGWKPIERAPKAQTVIVFDPDLGYHEATCMADGEWVYQSEGSGEYFNIDPTHYIEPPTTEQNP